MSEFHINVIRLGKIERHPNAERDGERVPTATWHVPDGGNNLADGSLTCGGSGPITRAALAALSTELRKAARAQVSS